MIGEKVLHFKDKNADPGKLADALQKHLEQQGFTVQRSADSSHGILLQAKKGGFLREVIAADRALSILISGSPNDLLVRIGIGKWIEHLAVTAIETLLISDIFLIIDVAETAWNFEIENKLVKDIEALVGQA
jgi:hypothetical protein